jgi:putative FmdB family regulatory protein
MPFYEYECSSCGHQHEAMRKISDGPLKKCPECGRNTLKRLMSAPVFRLKGGGWYETDFKGDKDNKRNLAVEKDDAPKVESADAGKDKTVDKPAAAAEPKADAPKPDAPEKSSGRSSVTVKRPAAAKRAPARKPAARKPAAKSRGARR